MPVKKKPAPKKPAKKAAVIKPPVVPFNMVLLRGDGFKERDKQAIYKYMQLKNHKQATTAVCDAVHGWFLQADTIQQLIKDKNDLIDQLAKVRQELRILHSQVGKVLGVTNELTDQKAKLESVYSELISSVPKIDLVIDHDDFDDNDDWDDDDQ